MRVITKRIADRIDMTTQLEAMDRNEKRAIEAVAADDDPDARQYLREEAGFEPGEIDAAASEVVDDRDHIPMTSLYDGHAEVYD